MSSPRFEANAAALAALIPDGASVAVPSDNSGVPMALTLEIIRAGKRGLRMIGGPTAGIQVDMLIGAGCVASVEAAGVSLGPRGLAPRFCAAVEGGEIKIIDSTCPATHAGYIAGEKRLPFMAVHGIFGSDVLTHRADWKIITNPFPPHQPLVVVPAINPDISIFHAPLADEHGNVWVGKRRELKSMARAAGKVLVTVDKIVPEDLAGNAELAPGLLASHYIDRIALAAGGAWPTALPPVHPEDGAELDAYAAAAQTREGFDRYLHRALTPRGPAQ
ncbi:CoA transferase subunit A [Bradyrhizobium sp. Ce-3]|uniref:CoA transferase subunit A n=1 Tax=Bradyrhizobium sp. Ce-3 TaxID=2913970 RepID=UPI001FC87BBE|nr:CoA-transferase [Bradyrhizobium sp. Ce-3]GKQ55124.1 CoA synthetase [Bradyrhizobium sp. Ce-3]